MSLLRIAELMEDLNIEYQFAEWLSEDDQLPAVFWTGEYIEEPVTDEAGRTTYEMLLSGTSIGTFAALELDKIKIRNKFRMGYRELLNDGSSMYILYNGSQLVPSQDQEIKRAEVSLMVHEWKVY